MTAKEEYVEVALVEVPLTKLMFWKPFTPEKVLLLARSVEEAAVILLLQPKEPFVYESACEALVQLVRPAP